MSWKLRLANVTDVPQLEALIPLSAGTLQASYYLPAQIQAALGPVFGVDRQLVSDGTYFVAAHENQIVGCGGWSKRKSLYGGSAGRGSDDNLLEPSRDAARIRAFFVHPDWARQGVGRSILAASEEAIAAAGFKTIELVATLPGEPLYAKFGYTAIERYEIDLPGGLKLPAVRMQKNCCTVRAKVINDSKKSPGKMFFTDNFFRPKFRRDTCRHPSFVYI